MIAHLVCFGLAGKADDEGNPHGILPEIQRIGAVSLAPDAVMSATETVIRHIHDNRVGGEIMLVEFVE